MGLILVGCESNHVVERSYIYISQFSWNGLSILCLHNITGLSKMARILLSDTSVA